MKKFLLSIFCVLAIAGLSVAAETNYWPNNTNAYPINLGATYGQNAYVVGVDKAAVLGSIAIGDASGVAYVKNATNAVQIGAGANTVANTIKYRGTQIYPTVGITSNHFHVVTSLTSTGMLTIVNGLITAAEFTGH
jgi:hypothetical protein